MSVDLNNLQLNEENLDIASDQEYVDAQEFPPPIPAGIYLLRQGEPTFKSSGGFLGVKMDQAVAQGPYAKENGTEPSTQFAGRTLRDNISDKPFERNGVRVSMAADHLRSLGDRTAYRTHGEFATAIQNKTNQLFKAQTDWEASCESCVDAKGQRLRVKGMRNFPLSADNERIPEVPCPQCGQQLRAFSRITRRIPA